MNYLRNNRFLTCPEQVREQAAVDAALRVAATPGCPPLEDYIETVTGIAKLFEVSADRVLEEIDNRLADWDRVAAVAEMLLEGGEYHVVH